MYKNKSAYCEGTIASYTERNPSQGIHWHTDHEIIFVLNGSLKLQINFLEIELNEGDMFLIVSNDSHKLFSQHPDTQVLFLMLDKSHCETLIPHLYESLAIVHYMKGFESLSAIKDVLLVDIKSLSNFIFATSDFNDATKNILDTKILNLLNHIVHSYTSKVPSINQTNTVSSEKLKLAYRVVDFVYDNYDRKLNLQELADKEYLTLPHLSRVISEVTGLNFRDWVNYVRAESAEKLLLSTDLPITAISEQCGFSNVRYFVKHFKKWYNVTPLAFRKTHKSSYSGNVTGIELSEKWSESIQKLPPSHSRKTDITLDFFSDHKELAKLEDMDTIVIPFSAMLKDSILNHFDVIKRELHFKYVVIPLTQSSFTKDLAAEHSTVLQKSFLNLSKTGLTITFEIDYSLNYDDESLAQVESLLQWATIFSDNFQVKKVYPYENNDNTNEPSTPFVKKFMRKRTNIYDLISVDGLKTPLYFYHFMMGKLFGKIIKEDEHYLVTEDSNSFRVFFFNETSSIKDKPLSYELNIEGKADTYKVVHYDWYLDLNDYREFTNTPNILHYLEGEEIDLFNMMSHPNISFEILEKSEKTSFPVILKKNNLQLLIVTAL